MVQFYFNEVENIKDKCNKKHMTFVLATKIPLVYTNGMNNLEKLKAHRDIARKVYDDYVNSQYQTMEPTNWPEIDRLARNANEADATLLSAMKETQKEPCTCNERTGSVCAPCYADNWDRYADTIPYKDGE